MKIEVSFVIDLGRAKDSKHWIRFITKYIRERLISSQFVFENLKVALKEL